MNELEAHFGELIGDMVSEKVVFFCGSGVRATQNILAMLHAGMGESRLYVGSWSDWILDHDRPVAKGGVNQEIIFESISSLYRSDVT
jgi:thiosulfate/3-mercaptopyruvate sulfurtransferase